LVRTGKAEERSARALILKTPGQKRRIHGDRDAFVAQL
jgi:hypothetical protein